MWFLNGRIRGQKVESDLLLIWIRFLSCSLFVLKEQGTPLDETRFPPNALTPLPPWGSDMTDAYMRPWAFRQNLKTEFLQN